MLGNVYINKRHARECLYTISLYCRKGFSNSFNFFVVSKRVFKIFDKKGGVEVQIFLPIKMKELVK